MQVRVGHIRRVGQVGLGDGRARVRVGQVDVGVVVVPAKGVVVIWFWFGAVWFGLVWFGLCVHVEQGSVVRAQHGAQVAREQRLAIDELSDTEDDVPRQVAQLHPPPRLLPLLVGLGEGGAGLLCRVRSGAGAQGQVESEVGGRPAGDQTELKREVGGSSRGEAREREREREIRGKLRRSSQGDCAPGAT